MFCAPEHAHVRAAERSAVSTQSFLPNPSGATQVRCARGCGPLMAAPLCAEQPSNDSHAGMRAGSWSSDRVSTEIIYFSAASSSEESVSGGEEPESSGGEESLSEESWAAGARFVTSPEAPFDLLHGAAGGFAAASSSEESGKDLFGAAFGFGTATCLLGAGWCAPSSSEESTIGAALFGAVVR